jgi:hypothetical protein
VLDVPVAPVVDHFEVARVEVEAGEVLRVGVLVGPEVERLAVGTPVDVGVLGVALVGRDVDEVALRDVEDLHHTF